MKDSGLFIVSTPIGNLEDISARALSTLTEVDLVAAEDTRRTGKLLHYFGIEAPMKSLHEHNERKVVPDLLRRLEAGDSIALVSDAGTPLISDPGYQLVKAAAAAGVRIVPVPGPSAPITALSVSGLPTDRFCFEGFLPTRPTQRRRTIEALASEPRTIVMFESSHRILDCVADLGDFLGDDRQIVVCRELTKTFESIYRGTATEVSELLNADEDHRKGEFVVVVSGAPEKEGDLAEALRLARHLLAHLPASQAARVAAAYTGVSRRELYAALEADSGP